MRKAFYSGLALLVIAFFASDSWAQKGGGHDRAKDSTHGSVTASANRDTHSVDADKDAHHGKHSKKTNTRSNKGGAVRGKERAEEVQGLNSKADSNRGFTTASGVEKAETKKGTSTSTTSGKTSKSKKH